MTDPALGNVLRCILVYFMRFNQSLNTELIVSIEFQLLQWEDAETKEGMNDQQVE